MPRILPPCSLLFIAIVAQAQEHLKPRLISVRTPSVEALPIDTISSELSRHLRCVVRGVTVTTTYTIPPFTTIQPALSRVAGVQYTPYSGAPGAWATVRIRGVVNVTGNSQPLYVVDGVPAYNTDVTPEQWTGPQSLFNLHLPTPHTPNANPLLDMPVEDVAMVEVVKGAAATARYGMQGSNGVILISTRRGADGQATAQPLRVRYAGWGGVQQVRRRYELLNARQYATMINDAVVDRGGPVPYTDADLNSLSETDWQDQVLRTAGMHSHNVSVDGLTARHTRYYVAADYLRQAGVMKQSSLSRYHLRTNLDQQLTSKLSVGLKVSASQADQRYAGREPDAGPLLQGALLGIPAVPARTMFMGSSVQNPRYELDFYHATPRTRRLLTQLSATYQFSGALNLSVRGSREQVGVRRLGYSPEDPQAPTARVAETSTATTGSYNWVADAVLRYQRTFGERHGVAATLTYLRQQYEREQESLAYTVNTWQSFRSQEKFTGRHNPSAAFVYTYAGRYEVQASLRTDITPTAVGVPTKAHWFPGAQLGWHFNKEAFLTGISGLNDLTLWVGSGSTSSYFSSDRTTHHDAGLRVGILDGKLTLEASAYQRRTRHAQTVLKVPATAFSGSSTTLLVPDVALRNCGLELTLTSIWWLEALASHTQVAAAVNRNQVDALNVVYSNNGRPLPELKEAEPVGSFLLYEQNGTYPAGSPSGGQIRYRDRNNDGRVDASDRAYHGSGLPRYTLTIHQQFQLKKFRLESQLDGLFGYQILNSTLAMLDTPTGNTNSSTRALDYWTLTRQNTSVPQPGSSSPYEFSNRSLESGNHVRLSQLVLSYAVLNSGTRKASVWVGGQNLFVTGPYRGYDPNVSSGGASPLRAGQDASVYPVARVWQVGVRGEF
jgi:TonB-dependent SusC/RagA subfamily outer membrane receptor